MFEDILKRFSKEHAFLTKEKLYSIYEKVADDIEQGFKDKGVWTKAFADSGGDLQKQKAIYIELMVERLVLAEATALEVAKKKHQLQQEKERYTFNKVEKLKEENNPSQYERELNKIQEEPLKLWQYIIAPSIFLLATLVLVMLFFGK